MTPAPALIRVRFLVPQTGPGLHAALGEERTAHRDEGLALIHTGQAELVADPWPPARAPSAAAKPAARKR